MTTGQIEKLHNLCIEINSPYERRKMATGELPTVFYSFHGETAMMEIWVFERGWDNDNAPDAVFKFYTCSLAGEHYRKALQYLKKLKNRVKKGV